MLKLYQVQGNQIACWINSVGFGDHEQSLVLIHGSGSNSTVWSYQYAQLHRQFNIAAVNLPGHGASDGKGEPDIDRYTRHVKDILDELKLTRPILIGHSMGAAIVLSFAASYPQDISGIVTVGGSATLPVNPNILEGLIKNPDDALDLICKFSLARENRPKLYDAIRTSFSASGIDILVSDMRVCDKVNLTDKLAGITVPTLVVCGAQDKMTPPQTSEALVAHIPGARLMLIEGAGHMVMMEKPDAFNNALMNFCEELK